eukprot:2415855-Amphidinium_carterae.1
MSPSGFPFSPNESSYLTTNPVRHRWHVVCTEHLGRGPSVRSEQLPPVPIAKRIPCHTHCLYALHGSRAPVATHAL